MKNKSPFVLLVLQATPFCNLDCKYCYLPDRLNKSKFDLDLIPLIMEKLIKEEIVEDELNINWHAGEPTILTPTFYKEAFDIFAKHNTKGLKIRHSFQTNATLLTPEYCEFLKEYDVAIGVSIDGPKYINDANRVYRNGKGSFDKTIRGIELLNKYNIEFTTISVLTENSLDYPSEIFEFLSGLNSKSLGFNVEEKEGCHTTTTIDNTMIDRYKQFLRKFNEKLLSSDKKIQQREYIKSLNSIIYQSDNYKNGLVVPLSTITISSTGDFTVFAPELLTVVDDNYGSFAFGNIKTDHFKDIFKDERFLSIYNEIKEGVEKCKKSCEYFSICGGGSPSNKLHENGTFDSTETNYCIYSTQIPAELVLEDLNH